MLKTKYRLQPVLDARSKTKEAAVRQVTLRREQLVAAQDELTRRERIVADCRAQQEAAQARMMDEAMRGIGAHTLVVHRTHLADLKRLEQELIGAVEQQRAVVARAEIELEKALAALVEASKEVQVIERHRISWQQRVRREEERREQKINDEFGMIIHSHRPK